MQKLVVGQGELTGLVANPVILSSDQSNTTAFKLSYGKVNFELQCTLELNQYVWVLCNLIRGQLCITMFLVSDN